MVGDREGLLSGVVRCGVSVRRDVGDENHSLHDMQFTVSRNILATKEAYLILANLKLTKAEGLGVNLCFLSEAHWTKLLTVLVLNCGGCKLQTISRLYRSL